MDRPTRLTNVTSPYSKYYKPRLRSDQNELLTKRLGASKLTRKELENKYYELCEENVITKRENNENKEKIKHLTTKLIRLSTNSGRSIKPREFFTTDETLKIRLIDIENQNSILKEQIKTMIIRYGKKIKDWPMDSPCFSDPTHRLEKEDKMDTKIDEHIATGKSLEQAVVSSFDDFYSVHSQYHDIKQSPKLSTDEAKEHDENRQQTKHADSHAIHEKEHGKSTSNALDKLNEIEKLQEEISNLNTHLNETRQINLDLLTEITDLRTKWSEIDMTKKLAEDMQVIELNRCLEEARTEMLRLRKHSDEYTIETCAKLNRERELIEELESKLKEEQDKTNEILTKLEHADAESKQVGELKKDLGDKDSEIEALRNQANSLQSIVKESGSNHSRIKELAEQNDDLKVKVEQHVSATSSLAHSQAQLLEKVKILQAQNDELIVELEGKKNENQFLKERNEELDVAVNKLKKLAHELEREKTVLCRTLNDIRQRNDPNKLTLCEAEAWSNKFPQISENKSTLANEEENGDVFNPVNCDYEIPVREIIKENKVRFFSRPSDHPKSAHKASMRIEKIVQSMYYKSSMQIFDSPKIQLERTRNTKRALKYYRYYHKMMSSTKVPASNSPSDDDLIIVDDNTENNYSDLSSIRCDPECSEIIDEDTSIELDTTSQPTNTVSCLQNGNNANNFISFKIDSLNMQGLNSHGTINIEFINRSDWHSKKFRLDATNLRQTIRIDDANNLNFLLIFSELNGSEFGFATLHHNARVDESICAGNMNYELDVYDVCFPHEILGKLIIDLCI